MNKKSPFPFGMIEGMMPMYPRIAFMGWMLLLIAFFIGLFSLSPAWGTFLSDAKSVREGAAAGSAFVQANTTIHVTEAWVPQLKFFGLGLGLMAITMALGTIAMKLRAMGDVILSHMPENQRPAMPAPPKAVRIFQLSTLMGVMILMIVLIIGILLATGVVPSYWAHSIMGDLNPAVSGSALLAQLGVVSSFATWLNPLRMVGMAFLFTSIILALKVIIGTLQLQSGLLSNFYQQASSK
ncbi:MAG: hypothetical protein H8D34_15690 [Chloroflexi bacterium]|nr:hypothetical protein [Chloroflexota bacterium]MBL6961298.1 hypothetical protein [Anaerolineales bacterium]